MPKSLGWKFTFCWTIRAEPRPTSKLASATLLSFATLFLANDALMSGNSTDYAHPHSLQHHNKFSPRRLFRPFCLVCAQTWSKNRSGPSRDILLLTTYNSVLCTHCTPSYLHPPIRPIHGRKNPTFFLFFQPCCSTQEREGCIVKPPHTRTLMHSPQLSHPPTS